MPDDTKVNLNSEHFLLTFIINSIHAMQMNRCFYFIAKYKKLSNQFSVHLLIN